MKNYSSITAAYFALNGLVSLKLPDYLGIERVYILPKSLAKKRGLI